MGKGPECILDVTLISWEVMDLPIAAMGYLVQGKYDRADTQFYNSQQNVGSHNVTHCQVSI